MAILKVEDLSISFGGLRALGGVNFSVEKGDLFHHRSQRGREDHGLQLHQRDLQAHRGKDLLQDQDITPFKPHQVAMVGIARTFQNIELFAHMTTMDNLMLGRHTKLKTGLWSGATFLTANSKAAREEIQNREKVEHIIDFLELQASRNQMVMNLPYGKQKLVELARALALEPEVLLLTWRPSCRAGIRANPCPGTIWPAA